jgi:hypothetical protein
MAVSPTASEKSDCQTGMRLVSLLPYSHLHSLCMMAVGIALVKSLPARYSDAVMLVLAKSLPARYSDAVMLVLAKSLPASPRQVTACALF